MFYMLGPLNPHIWYRRVAIYQRKRLERSRLFIDGNRIEAVQITPIDPADFFTISILFPKLEFLSKSTLHQDSSINYRSAVLLCCQLDIYFIVQIIIIMSILFIGERNPYYSPQLPKHHPNYRHERMMRQEQYRADLLHQIREKQQRRQRQRDQEARYQRQYETFLKRGPAPTIFSTPARQNNDNNYHISSEIPRWATQGEQDQDRTPTNYNRRRPIFTPITYDFPSLQSKHPPGRLRTQERPYSRSAFDQFTASLEKRQQELRQYQDKKFEEVYSKMYSSVDSLNNPEEQCELIKSRIKPLRLHLPSRHSTPYNPQPQEHYRLPPIVKLSRSKQRRKEEKEPVSENWRQWYARQKLRELQQYYQKALIEDQSRQHGENNNSRAATPAFARR